ncbi:MAG: putative A/G-specific adenine glycosylase YfhQ [candidate division BRC1 bacterium ADurb.BinA364]|nr:MAG: putative A/G-specific adenine glycosylase YfhQ [candidate division BRC1 bacterium ADurb.BinA364]
MHPNPEEQLKAKREPLRRALRRWYARQARDLPWRRASDPYRVWLSEIMLQQTRVEAALGYYERFLREFPTVGDLARADDDRALKLWEGLGYYSRARNLLKAAREIAFERAGRFPETAAEWARLPGVGRYTAGAIASIAFGERAAAVDGNIKRVLARLFAIASDVERADTLERLWSLAGALVPPRQPGDFNQALMDLGARICLPRRPRCAECPAAALCEARRRGIEENLPAKRPRKAIPHREIAVAVIARGGRYLIGKRPQGGMLGGLWEFPGGKLEAGENPEQALRRELREEAGVEVRVGERLATVRHAYSHFAVTLHVFRCAIASGRPQARAHEKLIWARKSEFGQYAFPTANRKFIELV